MPVVVRLNVISSVVLPKVLAEKNRSPCGSEATVLAGYGAR